MDLSSILELANKRRAVEGEAVSSFNQKVMPTFGNNNLGTDMSNLLSLAAANREASEAQCGLLGLSHGASRAAGNQIDLASLHRNFLLEEQLRRELMAQALLAQLQNLNPHSKLSAADVPAPSGKHKMQGSLWEQGGSSPKKHRVESTPIAAALRRPAKIGAIKSSFPVPSKMEGKVIRIKELTTFHKTWRLIQNRSAVIVDPKFKQSFDKELFARKLMNQEGSLAQRSKEILK